MHFSTFLIRVRPTLADRIKGDAKVSSDFEGKEIPLCGNLRKLTCLFYLLFLLFFILIYLVVLWVVSSQLCIHFADHSYSNSLLLKLDHLQLNSTLSNDSWRIKSSRLYESHLLQNCETVKILTAPMPLMQQRRGQRKTLKTSVPVRHNVFHQMLHITNPWEEPDDNFRKTSTMISIPVTNWIIRRENWTTPTHLFHHLLPLSPSYDFYGEYNA